MSTTYKISFSRFSFLNTRSLIGKTPHSRRRGYLVASTFSFRELDLYIELKHHDKSKDWSNTRKSLSDKMMFYPDGIRCTTLLIAIFDSGFTLTKESIERDFAKTMKTPHGDVAIRAVVASRATS